MYIIKNAFRNIVRSKGRNILMGIIIFIISVSLCIGLSIRQAATNAREDALSGLSITGQISVDRSKMMQEAKKEMENSSDKSFDKSKFKGFQDSLSVDELQKYAKASTVKSFYYTLSSSLDATGSLEAVTSSSSADNSSSSSSTDNSSSSSNSDKNNSNAPQNGMGQMPDQMGGGKAMMNNGDFSLIGYSSEDAMTDFVDGTCSIKDGSVFKEGTTDYNCIISDELATYNSLSVGDSITLCNPNNEDETYKLKIVGTYTSSKSTDTQNGMGQMFSAADPSNEIYMSYNALKKITDASSSSATTTTDSNGRESSSALLAQTNGTYTFANVDDYETFEKEVYTLGLSDDYSVSSTDLNAYEQSLVPLESLSTIAGYFLIVIIAIGALILIVLNIFSIRERKYEIGVLTAIGMKKFKVATQFICEMLIVTLMAVIIGGAVGSVSSVPVANALLSTQVSATQQVSSNREQAFGRGMEDAPNNNQNQNDNKSMNGGPQNDTPNNNTNYISQISSSVDITVLLQLLGICILLAMLASAVSVTAIMRYDPLRILSNRD